MESGGALNGGSVGFGGAVGDGASGVAADYRDISKAYNIR